MASDTYFLWMQLGTIVIAFIAVGNYALIYCSPGISSGSRFDPDKYIPFKWLDDLLDALSFVLFFVGPVCIIAGISALYAMITHWRPHGY